MSLEENKNVVRRFMTQVLDQGNMSVVDEVFAPNYVNRATGGGIESFKQFAAMVRTGLSDYKITIENLMAEGDTVVARFSMTANYTGSIMGSTPTGKPISARGLTYYRLENGKIVEDDPFTSPDLIHLLGITMPPAPQM